MVCFVPSSTPESFSYFDLRLCLTVTNTGNDTAAAAAATVRACIGVEYLKMPLLMVQLPERQAKLTNGSERTPSPDPLFCNLPQGAKLDQAISALSSRLTNYGISVIVVYFVYVESDFKFFVSFSLLALD